MLGSNYTIFYHADVLKKDIPNLPKTMKIRIKQAIETRLVIDPVGFGKPLRYSLAGHRRLRVGDYRIVFKIISEKQEVVIIAIKHRKKIYTDS